MKADAVATVEVEKNKKAPAPSTTNDRIWREVVSWFWVILAFLLIEGTLVQARVIPSGSMENTVLVGDHLIVSRIGYDAGVPFTPWHVPLWRNPKRQQIIVFRAPLPEEGNPDFIKRCIGIPGDHIRIVEGRVYVNGVLLREPYAVHLPDAADSPVENYPPSSIQSLGPGVTPEWTEQISSHEVNDEIVVPPGEYFMMGDNRDNSRDSRFWGFVPRANVIGTPVIIYMSIDAPDEVWGPGFAVDRFETYASVLVHPGRVRWKRLFHVF
ncbi:MAG TPA: signal peptidase I [Candidatus Acidoferrales bacterium]|nr:signal peptidase I [Candidatus Acidoferrales bacterium]